MGIHNRYAKDFVSPHENLMSLTHNFPYKELRNISTTDTEQIWKSLYYLKKITSLDLFYTNQLSVRFTLDFITTTLLNYKDSYPKDQFVDLLEIFKTMVTTLTAKNSWFALFPKLDVFGICEFLSKFKLFCAYCVSQCVPIMIAVLTAKPNFNYYCSLDSIIIKILKNFRLIEATDDFNIISGFIISKFPLESEAFQVCAIWLLEDSAETLNDLEIENITEDCPVSTIINNICTFFIKVRGSLKASMEMKKYQDIVNNFFIVLSDATPQLIKTCCVDSVSPGAKLLLGLVLQEFLNQQGILSEEIEIVTQEDIVQFPANINEWPTNCSRTFFWLCHLLYYNKRFVWSPAEITDALSKFIYTKKYMRLRNANILKSICFIYPILLQGTKIQKRKLFLIGNDLLIIISNYIPLLNRILSLSKWQLFWLLYKGTHKIKKITLKFWLDRIDEKEIPTLKQMVIDTKSEMALLDIFVSTLKNKSGSTHRFIQIIQSLHNMTVFKEIQALIPKFRANSDAVVALIQACCVEILVEDKAVATKIFLSICYTLDINPNNDVFINLCQYAVNVLKVLKTEDSTIESFCKDQFLIRTLISRLDVENDMVNLAVLKFLTTLFEYQKTACFLPENIIINLKRLLTSSSNDIVGSTIGFITQLLRVKLSIYLKEENVPLILYVLYDLTNTYLSDQAYECLFQILKSCHISPPEQSNEFNDVINAPVLGRLIDERCHFSNRERQSATFLKFVLFWIKRMRLNPNKVICFLPKQHTLESYINRSSVLTKSRASKYKEYISKIYATDDQLDLEIEDDLFSSFIRRCNMDN